MKCWGGSRHSGAAIVAILVWLATGRAWALPGSGLVRLGRAGIARILPGRSSQRQAPTHLETATPRAPKRALSERFAHLSYLLADVPGFRATMQARFDRQRALTPET